MRPRFQYRSLKLKSEGEVLPRCPCSPRSRTASRVSACLASHATYDTSSIAHESGWRARAFVLPLLPPPTTPCTRQPLSLACWLRHPLRMPSLGPTRSSPGARAGLSRLSHTTPRRPVIIARARRRGRDGTMRGSEYAAMFERRRRAGRGEPSRGVVGPGRGSCIDELETLSFGGYGSTGDMKAPSGPYGAHSRR